jgi:FkbM family methyltransferase
MTGIVRRTAERVLGPVTVQRRLPLSAGGGRLIASARVGGLKYLMKGSEHLDPQLLRIASLLVQTNDVVWDVGANVGLFSVAAAARAGENGRVFAVEADMDAVTLLNRTVQLHSYGHAEITVLPLAVGSALGFVQFQIAARARASNAILGYGSTQMGGVREIRMLPSMPLDYLLAHFPGPHVVKIDVEGAELQVLLGAGGILTNQRPRIYCEVATNKAKEVTALFRAHGYRLWDGAVFDAIGSGEVSCAASNTVALPEEKVSFPDYASNRQAGPLLGARAGMD